MAESVGVVHVLAEELEGGGGSGDDAIVIFIFASSEEARTAGGGRGRGDRKPPGRIRAAAGVQAKSCYRQGRKARRYTFELRKKIKIMMNEN